VGEWFFKRIKIDKWVVVFKSKVFTHSLTCSLSLSLVLYYLLCSWIYSFHVNTHCYSLTHSLTHPNFVYNTGCLNWNKPSLYYLRMPM
jgi:hypothetical protein